MSEFIGRREELSLLKSLAHKTSASLVVIYGRRRVGKSRLVEEFCKELPAYTFSGLPPQAGATKQSQLDEFSNQLSRQFSIEAKKILDWGEAFVWLSEQIKSGRVVLFFDEISWMGNQDPDFLGKLKNAWDLLFKKNDQLILILCGSVSSWVKKNILANTGFYGRISLKIHLQELSLNECNDFWQKQQGRISSYEKLKILAVTGGIPKYLEEIRGELTADENIRRLCFSDSGLLFNDYDYIFSALMERDSQYYRRIIEQLAEGSSPQEEISHTIGLVSGSTLSEYLNDLTVSGFIQRDYTWNLKTGAHSKLSQYRLSDNYLRFYLKYIKPNISKIRNRQFENSSMSSLPGWASIMGLQIENLVLNNRSVLKKLIGIHADEVVCDGPFFQKTTARQKGCQIDYLVQTKYGNLFVCEIKFSRSVIRGEIVEEVKEKINRMLLPKHFSVIPVLIHLGDVHDEVVETQFFARIISVEDFLLK